MYLAPVDPDPNAQREQSAGGDSFFGGEGEEEFIEAAPAPPQRTAPQRSAAPAPRPGAPASQPTRPMNAATTNTRPSTQGGPQQRRSAPPPPPANDIDDFEDPFGE